MPVDTFKWWTRLHYCAADSTPQGKPTGWGEHEMDYILGLQADVDVKPNPEEVPTPVAQRLAMPLCGAGWCGDILRGSCTGQALVALAPPVCSRCGGESCACLDFA